MSRFSAALLLVAGVSSMAHLLHSLPATAAELPAYKVGAGDVLTITVYGDAGLTGAFPVSVEGTIGFPLLGNVRVSEKTIDEIGTQISNDLATHVANRSVAVAIKEYAPTFIVGDVQKPGRYEYRPGMSVLELFALSGGLRETTARADMSAIQLISAQQEYEDMSVQLLAQDVKRVRLEAERNNVTFDYKNDGLAPTRDLTTLDKIVGAEKDLFQLRLSTHQSEKANLEVQRQNFIQEIETLEKSSIMRNEQFQLLGLDVNASEELVARGAASQSALRERKRELLAMNQQVLESASFLARARQNKSEVERRMMELESNRRNDAATQLREIELDMVRLRRKMTFSLQTMAEVGATSRRMTNLEQIIQTKFTIVRQFEGLFQEIDADEQTRIEAGDVIRVSLVASTTAAGAAAGARTQGQLKGSPVAVIPAKAEERN